MLKTRADNHGQCQRARRTGARALGAVAGQSNSLEPGNKVWAPCEGTLAMRIRRGTTAPPSPNEEIPQ